MTPRRVPFVSEQVRRRYHNLADLKYDIYPRPNRARGFSHKHCGFRGSGGQMKQILKWGSGPGDNSPRVIGASVVRTEHLLYGAFRAGTVRRSGHVLTAGGEGITAGYYWLVKHSSR
ncbi:hypothetical protein SRHO_G00303480 [Serrasalmus rhombeus]